MSPALAHEIDQGEVLDRDPRRHRHGGHDEPGRLRARVADLGAADRRRHRVVDRRPVPGPRHDPSVAGDDRGRAAHRRAALPPADRDNVGRRGRPAGCGIQLDGRRPRACRSATPRSRRQRLARAAHTDRRSEGDAREHRRRCQRADARALTAMPADRAAEPTGRGPARSVAAGGRHHRADDHGFGLRGSSRAPSTSACSIIRAPRCTSRSPTILSSGRSRTTPPGRVQPGRERTPPRWRSGPISAIGDPDGRAQRRGLGPGLTGRRSIRSSSGSTEPMRPGRTRAAPASVSPSSAGSPSSTAVVSTPSNIGPPERRAVPPSSSQCRAADSRPPTRTSLDPGVTHGNNTASLQRAHEPDTHVEVHPVGRRLAVRPCSPRSPSASSSTRRCGPTSSRRRHRHGRGGGSRDARRSTPQPHTHGMARDGGRVGTVAVDPHQPMADRADDHRPRRPVRAPRHAGRGIPGTFPRWARARAGGGGRLRHAARSGQGGASAAPADTKQQIRRSVPGIAMSLALAPALVLLLASGDAFFASMLGTTALGDHLVDCSRDRRFDVMAVAGPRRPAPAEGRRHVGHVGPHGHGGRTRVRGTHRPSRAPGRLPRGGLPPGHRDRRARRVASSLAAAALGGAAYVQRSPA